MLEPERGNEEEHERELDDLEVKDETAEEVRGGAYEPYISIKGTKQGPAKGP